MNNRTDHWTRFRVVFMATLVVGAFAIAMAPTATAHGGNHGTIKVHDDAQADPGPNNEPHVSCDFWIEGFNMDGSAGELVFKDWPPTGDKSVVVPSGASLDWSGTPEDDDDGYHFLAGPYQLPPGHYQVRAFSDEGHPGDHGHFAKQKMFWSDGCDDDNPCEGLELEMTANEGGSITLDISHAIGSDGTRLYRAVGAGPFLPLADIDEAVSQFEDTDTVIGQTYAYAGTALNGDDESDFCDGGEITSVPVFPGAIGAMLAVLFGVLGYAVSRRRF